MQITQIQVSPSTAQQWLLLNTTNRPLSTTWVRHLSSLMDKGLWHPGHQAIAFSGDIHDPKRLLDGQHRLSAVVRHGKTISMSVCFNVPDSTFQNIDNVKARSFQHRNGWTKDDSIFCNTINRLINSDYAMDVVFAERVMSVLGHHFHMMRSVCGSNVKGLTSASVWLGVVLAMSNSNNPEKIALAYRDMVRGNVTEMPASVGYAYAKLLQRTNSGRADRDFQLAISYNAFSNFTAKRIGTSSHDAIRVLQSKMAK